MLLWWWWSPNGFGFEKTDIDLHKTLLFAELVHNMEMEFEK